MLVAFARYSRDQSFHVLRSNGRFLAAMSAGSITGTVLGGVLLGAVPEIVLIPLLIGLLLLSSVTERFPRSGRVAGDRVDVPQQP
ncbi:hypothetical protein, partial [Saccharopolyspora sp. NPDC049357]|uniref:hypothetical protein n=1 Tax=Saccharopolyspora sp. NPDC049357 TaxID=3154507 RepID=UPI003449EE71